MYVPTHVDATEMHTDVVHLHVRIYVHCCPLGEGRDEVSYIHTIQDSSASCIVSPFPIIHTPHCLCIYLHSGPFHAGLCCMYILISIEVIRFVG